MTSCSLNFRSNLVSVSPGNMFTFLFLQSPRSMAPKIACFLKGVWWSITVWLLTVSPFCLLPAYNYCANNGSCSHLCLPRLGGFTCRCPDDGAGGRCVESNLWALQGAGDAAAAAAAGTQTDETHLTEFWCFPLFLLESNISAIVSEFAVFLASKSRSDLAVFMMSLLTSSPVEFRRSFWL